MNLQLENKTALGIGSIEEIGFAIARVLAAEGAQSPEEFDQDFFGTMGPTSIHQRETPEEEVANIVEFWRSPLANATNVEAARVDGGFLHGTV